MGYMHMSLPNPSHLYALILISTSPSTHIPREQPHNKKKKKENKKTPHHNVTASRISKPHPTHIPLTRLIQQ